MPINDEKVKLFNFSLNCLFSFSQQEFSLISLKWQLPHLSDTVACVLVVRSTFTFCNYDCSKVTVNTEVITLRDNRGLQIWKGRIVRLWSMPRRCYLTQYPCISGSVPLLTCSWQINAFTTKWWYPLGCFNKPSIFRSLSEKVRAEWKSTM